MTEIAHGGDVLGAYSLRVHGGIAPLCDVGGDDGACPKGVVVVLGMMVVLTTGSPAFAMLVEMMVRAPRVW